MKLSLYLFFLINILVAHAQDIHYSQFDVMISPYNPAAISNITEKMRIAADYRNQWLNFDYRYSTAQAEFIYKFEKGGMRKLSISAYTFYDYISNTGVSKFGMNTSLAYPISIKKHEIALGLQVGFFQRNVNLNERTFPNQWDYLSGIYNQNIPNQEPVTNLSKTNLDVGTGVHWSFTNQLGMFSSGVALNHINQPNDGIVSNNKIAILYNAHLAYKMFFNNSNWSLEPKIRYLFSNRANQLVGGIETHVYFDGKNDQSFKDAIIIGFYARAGFKRNFDSLIPFVGFKKQRTQVVLSNDINIGGFSKDFGVKHSPEISFIYSIPVKKVNFYAIPCGIY